MARLTRKIAAEYELRIAETDLKDNDNEFFRLFAEITGGTEWVSNQIPKRRIVRTESNAYWGQLSMVTWELEGSPVKATIFVQYHGVPVIYTDIAAGELKRIHMGLGSKDYICQLCQTLVRKWLQDNDKEFGYR